MCRRASGILLHISSLPSPHGIGDLGENAYRFADILSQAHQSYWQVLPLNPTSTANGESPYFSASVFAGNPLLISLDTLARQGLVASDQIHPPERLPSDKVDYDRIRQFKMDVLQKAYTSFKKKGDMSAFAAFCSRQASWLDDYALFAVLKTLHGDVPWARWPLELRDRHPQVLDAARDENCDRIEEMKFCQYLFFEQWSEFKRYANAHGILVIGDIPIYVSYDSADVWVNSGLFKLDGEKRPTGVSGVPPDYFSSTGQLWNNPVYNWDALRNDGYRWWAERMGAMFERFDIVRIDHFRGLVQYWEVPAGDKTATNGVWNDVPAYDFFDTMRNRFPSFPVIAEDLGTITPDVVEVKEHYGFPGMKVLMFAFGEDNPQNPYLPHNYERNCIVYTGTHDNNTFRAWFEEEAGAEGRKRLFAYLGRELGVEEAAWETIRLAMMSVADTAIVPLQDLLVLEGRARMNNPAETLGNWKWRLSPQARVSPFVRVSSATSASGTADFSAEGRTRPAGVGMKQDRA